MEHAEFFLIIKKKMKNKIVFVAILLLLAINTLGCNCDCCANTPPTSGVLTPPIISVPAINVPIIGLPIKPILPQVPFHLFPHQLQLLLKATATVDPSPTSLP